MNCSIHAVKWRWGCQAVLDRIIILLAAPDALLALLSFQLLLSLGIGEAKAEFDTILGRNHVEILQDLFRSFSILESGKFNKLLSTVTEGTYLAKPTSLLTPVISSRTIFSDTARYGKKWSRRS